MKIGYQLYSALEHCGDAAGLRRTIEKIAAMGYQGVEFFDYAGIPAAEMRAFLAGCGVEAINAHVPLAKWRSDFAGEVAYAREAGLPMITIPWIPPEERTPAVYRELAARIPGWAAEAARAGVRIGYHNHEFEYEAVDGTPALDIIAAACGDLLLELDTFWIHYAGFDPVAEMAKRRDRLGPLHIKDYVDKTSSPPAFCAIGRGRMANAPIVRYARELDLPWIVVEQDNSAIDVFQSAEMSLAALRAL